jgi:integrase
MKTSKSKYRAAANFDLTIYSLLYPLLEAVPHHERTGAIVKGEHGYAVQERTYRKWFRPIAQAAGIPDDVWNMDSRAGAATEAEESGADHDAIKTLLTHSDKQEATTTRYKRRQDRARVVVQQLREASRKPGGNA